MGCASEEEDILASFSPLHSSLGQSLLNLGKPGRALALQGMEKSVLIDALNTGFFLPRLNVGFIVIQEYPSEGLADELTVCLKLFSKLPYLIGFVTFIYN